MPEWTITATDEGRSCLDFLRRTLPQAPPSYLRRLLARDKVLCNGKPAAADRTLTCGDRLAAPNSQRLLEFASMADTGLRILCETPAFLVVDKPGGLATHGNGPDQADNLVSRVRSLLQSRGETYMIAAAHRLDAQTSGPVLIGKGRKAVAALGRIMQDGLVSKRYLALVRCGLPASGTFTGQIESRGKPRPARTDYRVLETANDMSLVELTPLSGRQHQIRRHLSANGYPIAGDRRYRGPGISGLHRLFLHCTYLGFNDPSSGQPFEISSGLPPELEHVLRRLGFDPPGMDK